MPIGTKSTAILLKNYRPKITRATRKESEQSFWSLFFETLLITVAATAVAAVTGGVASAALLSIGASDFIAASTSFATRVLVEFAINQSIDAAREQVTSKSTIFNLLLPIAFNANQVARGYRLTKILRLAKDTKTLEKLGVTEAKNFQEIINRLSNTQVLTKSINGKSNLFNFSKKLTREEVLQDLGFIAQESFKFNFKEFSALEIKENLLLQVNIAKLSPKLMPMLKIKNLDNVNDFLAKFGTDYDTVVTKMTQSEWLKLIGEIQKTNSGKTLVLALQQIRNTTIKYNLNSHVISRSFNKITRSFKYFDFNYYVNKGLEKYWKNTPYFAKLREKILIMQEKIEAIEAKALSKIDKLKKQGKDLFKGAEKVAVQKLKLIPLNSPVFLACKIEPSLLDKVIITIFYKDNRYNPIVVTDTLAKAEAFIVQEHPFSWYWNQSGWAFGYGINKHSILNLVNLLPATAREVIQESLRINFQLKRLTQIPNRISKLTHPSLNKILMTTPVNFLLKTTLNNRSTRFFRPFISNAINKRQTTSKSMLGKAGNSLRRKVRRKETKRRW